MTDLKAMTDDELDRHVTRLWNEWMFHEAAERGYDHQAAWEASKRLSEAKAELALRKCRRQSEPLLQAIDSLVGSAEP